jgi:hypothetical protein
MFGEGNAASSVVRMRSAFQLTPVLISNDLEVRMDFNSMLVSETKN